MRLFHFKISLSYFLASKESNTASSLIFFPYKNRFFQLFYCYKKANITILVTQTVSKYTQPMVNPFLLRLPLFRFFRFLFLFFTYNFENTCFLKHETGINKVDQDFIPVYQALASLLSPLTTQ